MTYLILTILLNTIIGLAFKFFDKWKVDNLQVIVVNYWVCVITGSIVNGAIPISTASIQYAWFPWAIVMGVSFFLVFNFIAFCTLKEGVTATTIANKLSMAIPVCFAVLLYKDVLTTNKIAGLLLAVPAILLTTTKEKTANKSALNDKLLLLVLFCLSGLLDTLVTYISKQYFYAEHAQEQSIYLVHNFGIAAITGTMVIVFLFFTGRQKLQFKNIIAGILLGIPNYFSIHYLFLLLGSGFMKPSVAIPVNNIGVVLLSAIAAIFFFKESATPRRIAGLALSVIAILLIAFSDAGS